MICGRAGQDDQRPCGERAATLTMGGVLYISSVSKPKGTATSDGESGLAARGMALNYTERTLGLANLSSVAGVISFIWV